MTEGTERRYFPTRKCKVLVALREIETLVEMGRDPEGAECVVLLMELETLRDKLDFLRKAQAVGRAESVRAGKRGRPGDFVVVATEKGANGGGE